MDLWQWIQQGGVWLVALAGIVGALTAIVTGGGRFGQWMRGKLTGSIETEMHDFMRVHADCKPTTEREISDLKARMGKAEELLERDWDSIRLLIRMADVHAEHIIHGNHLEQVRSGKDDLHRHLIDR